MKKILALSYYVLLSNYCIGQVSLAEHLKTLSTFEDKAEFSMDSKVSLDSVRELLTHESDEFLRLELLLFYLDQQFKLDASQGLDKSQEAIRIAEKNNLDLHKGKAILKLATIYSLITDGDTAFLYLDSALVLAEKIGDRVLESAVYNGRYFHYLMRNDQLNAVKNLLKSVELADDYAKPRYLNHRITRLAMLAQKYKRPTLSLNFLEKVDVNYLNELKLRDFYDLKINSFIQINNKDSIDYYLKKSLEIALYKPIADYLYEMGELDSALVLYQMAVEYKNPAESYFDELYYPMSQIYLKKGDVNSTEEYLKKCISEAIRLKERINQAKSYVDIAEFYSGQNNRQSSIEYALQAYNIAKSNKYITIQIRSLAIMTKHAVENGNFPKAYLFSSEMLELKNDDKDIEASGLLYEAEIIREMENWSLENSSKLKSMNDTKNAFIVFFIVSVVLSLWLWYIYRLKKKRLETELIQTRTIQMKNEKIRAQEKILRKANEDLDNLNTKLNDSNTELEERVSKRTKELEGVNKKLNKRVKEAEGTASLTSHDLRGPWSNIKGLIDLYQKMDDTEGKDSMVERMIPCTNDIEEVMIKLEALMDVNNKSLFVAEEVDLSVLADDLKSRTESSLSSEIDFFTEIKVASISTVRRFLFSALTQLITNAYKYRSIDRKLVIRLFISPTDHGVLVKLEDNGDGIDMEKYGDDIFKLHQRLHKKSGRGIGLYLVKRQIEGIGGAISLDSKLGHGSSLKIEFSRFSL